MIPVAASRMNFRQRPTTRTQCAGQTCEEREGCARYSMRVSGSPWASFDIERVRFDGHCLHRIDLQERTQ